MARCYCPITITQIHYFYCKCGCALWCKCRTCGLLDKPGKIGGKCFPAEAQLLLDTDETIQVKDLRAGQRVLAGKCNKNLEQNIEL